MTAVVHPSSCPIVARGLGAGALWGAFIAVGVLFGGSVVSGDLVAMALTPVVVVGAVVGGTIGLLSGVALALYERGGDRTDRDRRWVAVVMSVVAWTLVGIVAHSVTVVAMVLLLVLAAVGAVAGALLAPCVVHGQRLPPSPYG